MNITIVSQDVATQELADMFTVVLACCILILSISLHTRFKEKVQPCQTTGPVFITVVVESCNAYLAVHQVVELRLLIFSSSCLASPSSF